VPKDSALQSPLFMVDVKNLYKGIPCISADEEMFAQEFERVDRWDVADLLRNARKSRCFEFSIYTDTRVRGDFEALFAGAWRAIEGEEKELSWGQWKAQAQMKQFDSSED
jgi:hypothetical protein